ncbi:hypothetical protein FEZ41_00145 [Lentilactobacillus parafarraginis]|uniref:Uncharacterized protein n=2 Tax=Lentilactobacillus parafarraginis TaxID=390842 RepID=A0A0R1Z117_9LACO|nr:hypothetical protein [Lentilactobacillus parafarraginis]KRM45579.1 hypothetical protein FD47_GL001414 [Lentilactobacillus parafarraginis DSM 18390 = JCM 14109]TLQ21143.1 hypothetical protein FEZ41_00145 [Lentilactobacillus parafarraginis]
MNHTIGTTIIKTATQAMQHGQMVRLVLDGYPQRQVGLGDLVGYITGIKDHQLTFTNVMSQNQFVALADVKGIEFIMK